MIREATRAPGRCPEISSSAVRVAPLLKEMMPKPQTRASANGHSGSCYPTIPGVKSRLVRLSSCEHTLKKSKVFLRGVAQLIGGQADFVESEPVSQAPSNRVVRDGGTHKQIEIPPQPLVDLGLPLLQLLKIRRVLEVTHHQGRMLFALQVFVQILLFAEYP